MVTHDHKDANADADDHINVDVVDDDATMIVVMAMI